MESTEGVADQAAPFGREQHEQLGPDDGVLKIVGEQVT